MLISKELQEKMNAAYGQLEEKRNRITSAFAGEMLELESGWYNGHFGRAENGGWYREAYPIPVVSVKGLCDAEISFDKISISTKLKRVDALEYPYTRLRAYDFEAFGVEDYLSDYYHSGQTIDELKSNIEQCGEREIGFAFIFPANVETEAILELVKLLKTDGFYY